MKKIKLYFVATLTGALVLFTAVETNEAPKTRKVYPTSKKSVK